MTEIKLNTGLLAFEVRSSCRLSRRKLTRFAFTVPGEYDAIEELEAQVPLLLKLQFLYVRRSDIVGEKVRNETIPTHFKKKIV